MYKIIEKYPLKECLSPDYNYIFNLINGYFLRWGKTKDEDPQFSPFPEILDIEVTTSCKGIPDEYGVCSPCSFCYKSNTPNGKNMSYKTFNDILDKFGNGLTQIAFGADSDATSNPDLFSMMYLAKKRGIVPNITLANVADNIVDNLVNLCGAVAISRYSNKEICYKSVKKLTDAGMKQVNIHMLLSEETYDTAVETAHHTVNDTRLSDLNALVFLSLKQKGRGENFTPLSFEKFKKLILFCLNNDISFGMDSCSANKFLKVIKGTRYENCEQYVEPCEATCFSSYINVDGMFYPCSFAEDTYEGIDVLAYDSFNDVWENSGTKAFRKVLLENNRTCPIYKI